jgi:hypothetical protein
MIMSKKSLFDPVEEPVRGDVRVPIGFPTFNAVIARTPAPLGTETPLDTDGDDVSTMKGNLVSGVKTQEIDLSPEPLLIRTDVALMPRAVSSMVGDTQASVFGPTDEQRLKVVVVSDDDCAKPVPLKSDKYPDIATGALSYEASGEKNFCNTQSFFSNPELLEAVSLGTRYEERIEEIMQADDGDGVRVTEPTDLLKDLIRENVGDDDDLEPDTITPPTPTSDDQDDSTAVAPAVEAAPDEQPLDDEEEEDDVTDGQSDAAQQAVDDAATDSGVPDFEFQDSEDSVQQADDSDEDLGDPNAFINESVIATTVIDFVESVADAVGEVVSPTEDASLEGEPDFADVETVEEEREVIEAATEIADPSPTFASVYDPTPAAMAVVREASANDQIADIDARTIRSVLGDEQYASYRLAKVSIRSSTGVKGWIVPFTPVQRFGSADEVSVSRADAISISKFGAYTTTTYRDGQVFVSNKSFEEWRNSLSGSKPNRIAFRAEAFASGNAPRVPIATDRVAYDLAESLMSLTPVPSAKTDYLLPYLTPLDEPAQQSRGRAPRVFRGNSWLFLPTTKGSMNDGLNGGKPRVYLTGEKPRAYLYDARQPWTGLAAISDIATVLRTRGLAYRAGFSDDVIESISADPIRVPAFRIAPSAWTASRKPFTKKGYQTRGVEIPSYLHSETVDDSEVFDFVMDLTKDGKAVGFGGFLAALRNDGLFIVMLPPRTYMEVGGRPVTKGKPRLGFPAVEIVDGPIVTRTLGPRSEKRWDTFHINGDDGRQRSPLLMRNDVLWQGYNPLENVGVITSSS